MQGERYPNRMRKKGEFTKKTLSIRIDQARWLREHPVFILSDFVQQCLDKHIYVHARIVRITGRGKNMLPLVRVESGYILSESGSESTVKVGTLLLIERERFENLPQNRLGKYILRKGKKFYVKPVG